MSDISDEKALPDKSIKKIQINEPQDDERQDEEIPIEENSIEEIPIEEDSIEEIPIGEIEDKEIPSEEREKLESVVTKVDKNIKLRKNMENEIMNVEKYYKKKAYYNNLKKKQIIKIRKNNELTKEEKKERAKKIKLPCVFCKKLVGTIFEKKDGFLIAKCGKDECGDVIKIRMYDYINSESLKQEYYEDLRSLKEKIIELKSKLLFNFIDEDKAIIEFKTLNDDLSIISELYLHNLKKYTNHPYNINFVDDELQELIKEYNKQVDIIKSYHKKYKDEPTESYLNDIASVYKDILLPLNQEIRSKKYKYMEVVTEKENDKYITKLKYNSYTPMDVEEFYDMEDELKTKTSSYSK